jgi:hypothetical protein
MGEQYPDQVVDSSGKVVQRKWNFVSIEEILERYDNPKKFAAIVLHGCSLRRSSVVAKNVPVFFPRIHTRNSESGGWIWDAAGGFSKPQIS